MNVFEFGGLSLLGNEVEWDEGIGAVRPGRPKASQQDALRSAIGEDQMTICLLDGMSGYGKISTQFTPDLAQYLVQEAHNARDSRGLVAVLRKAHEWVSSTGFGAAAVLVNLHRDGTCHYAMVGDVALWASKDGSSWRPLNQSQPHEYHGGNQTLRDFLGAPFEDPGITSGVRSNVGHVIGMTDGFYDFDKLLIARRADGGGGSQGPVSQWHPDEPYKFQQGRGQSPQRVLRVMAPEQSLDNYSAFYVRRVAAEVEVDVLDVIEADPVPKVLGLVATLIAAVAVVVFMLPLFTNKPDQTQRSKSPIGVSADAGSSGDVATSEEGRSPQKSVDSGAH